MKTMSVRSLCVGGLCLAMTTIILLFLALLSRPSLSPIGLPGILAPMVQTELRQGRHPRNTTDSLISPKPAAASKNADPEKVTVPMEKDKQQFCDQWTLTQRFLEVCGAMGVALILMDPRLLRDMEEDRASPWEGVIWSPTPCSALTFGVVDPRDDTLERLSKAFSATHTLFHHVIYDVDPRHVSASSFVGQKVPPIIPLHYVWWSNDNRRQAWPLHVVVLRARGDYLWYGGLSPVSSVLPVEDRTRGHSLPFHVLSFAIGREPAWIDSTFPQICDTRNDRQRQTILLPANIRAFLQSLEAGKLMECNHVTARHLVTHYTAGWTHNAGFQRRVVDIMNITARALDSMGLRFWLSAGTLLGWYRQCDVIPYTNDVDIELTIQDYSPNVTRALQDGGLRLVRQLGKVDDSFELTFTLGGLRIDLFFIYEEKKTVWYGMFSSGSLKKYRYVFPKYTWRWADFFGLRVRVPYPPEVYLEAAYGKEWTTPSRQHNWLLGPHNTVYSGKWPKKDKDKVQRFY